MYGNHWLILSRSVDGIQHFLLMMTVNSICIMAAVMFIHYMELNWIVKLSSLLVRERKCISWNPGGLDGSVLENTWIIHSWIHSWREPGSPSTMENIIYNMEPQELSSVDMPMG